MSSRIRLTSSECAYLALVDHLRSHGVTIKVHVVDILLYRPALYPIIFYLFDLKVILNCKIN